MSNDILVENATLIDAVDIIAAMKLVIECYDAMVVNMMQLYEDKCEDVEFMNEGNEIVTELYNKYLFLYQELLNVINGPFNIIEKNRDYCFFLESMQQ